MAIFSHYFECENSFNVSTSGTLIQLILPSMQKNRNRLYSLIIPAFLIVGCGQEQVEQVSAPVVRPIKLLTIEEASSSRTLSYPAVLSAAESAELSFQVSGHVVELPFAESQKVKEGDVIARLDTQAFENELAKAQAQYKSADEEYQRAVTLDEQNAIAKSVLDDRNSARKIARAALDSAKKALNDTVLVAPFGGAIASLLIEIEQNIQAGSAVATVMDITEMEATINIPASIIAEAESRTDSIAIVRLDVAPDSAIEAEFKEADLLADTASQTYAVTFSFPRPANLLIFPGMNATVELSSSSLVNEADESRVSVPLASILNDGANQYVWLVDKDKMTVSKRAVTVEQGIGELLVVTEGLSAGDLIAGAGANYLSEGVQVRPWTN